MITWGPYREYLDQSFAHACDDVLGSLPDVWIVTAGFRSLAQQAALYAQGRDAAGAIVNANNVVTWATPGSSAHNCGLAIDVGLSGPGGNSTWDYTEAAWQRLWQAVRASPTLHSGEDFPAGETDPDHIERVNWRAHEPSAPASTTHV